MESGFLFTRLADGFSSRYWNGSDAKGKRTHHGFIPVDDSLIELTLGWQTDESSQSRHVGTYRLNLTELVNAGYIRTDTYHGKEGFRLKFIHAENGCIYIQKDSKSPGLIVGHLNNQLDESDSGE
jgi:hypothetical protein